MHIWFTRVFLVLLIAAFSTTAFTSTLPVAVQELSYKASESSWFDGMGGSEPLLLASASDKKEKVKVCKIKTNKKTGKKKFKNMRLKPAKFVSKQKKKPLVWFLEPCNRYRSDA